MAVKRSADLTAGGVSLLGIDPATNKLYWDGKEVVVRDRVRLGGWANFLAILVALRSRLSLWSLATR